MPSDRVLKNSISWDYFFSAAWQGTGGPSNDGLVVGSMTDDSGSINLLNLLPLIDFTRSMTSFIYIVVRYFWSPHVSFWSRVSAPEACFRNSYKVKLLALPLEMFIHQ